VLRLWALNHAKDIYTTYSPKRVANLLLRMLFMKIMFRVLWRFRVSMRLISWFFDTIFYVCTFFSRFLFFPIRIKHIFKEICHGLFERIIVIVGSIDEVVDHLHDEVIVDSRFPVLIFIGKVREVVIFYWVCIIFFIRTNKVLEFVRDF
jgi:hypothetical protein